MKHKVRKTEPNLPDGNQEQIIQYVKIDGHPIATFVAIKNELGMFNVGLSVCSEKEKFSKVRGKTLAINRIYKGQEIFFVPEKLLPIIKEDFFYFKQRLEKKSKKLVAISHPISIVVRHKYEKIERKYPYVGRYNFKKQFDGPLIPTNPQTYSDFRVLFTRKNTGYMLDTVDGNRIIEYAIDYSFDEQFFDIDIPKFLIVE